MNAAAVCLGAHSSSPLDLCILRVCWPPGWGEAQREHQDAEGECCGSRVVACNPDARDA